MQAIHSDEFIKIFLKDDFLKLLILEAKKFPLPDIFKQIVEKIDAHELATTVAEVFRNEITR